MKLSPMTEKLIDFFEKHFRTPIENFDHIMWWSVCVGYHNSYNFPRLTVEFMDRFYNIYKNEKNSDDITCLHLIAKHQPITEDFIYQHEADFDIQDNLNRSVWFFVSMNDNLQLSDLFIINHEQKFKTGHMDAYGDIHTGLSEIISRKELHKFSRTFLDRYIHYMDLPQLSLFCENYKLTFQNILKISKHRYGLDVFDLIMTENSEYLTAFNSFSSKWVYLFFTPKQLISDIHENRKDTYFRNTLIGFKSLKCFYAPLKFFVKIDRTNISLVISGQ